MSLDYCISKVHLPLSGLTLSGLTLQLWFWFHFLDVSFCHFRALGLCFKMGTFIILNFKRSEQYYLFDFAWL